MGNKNEIIIHTEGKVWSEAAIEFLGLNPNTNAVETKISLRIEDFSVSVMSVFYVCDIERFVGELMNLQRDLCGSAVLVDDYSGGTEMTFECIHQGKGEILVGLKYQSRTCNGEIEPPGALVQMAGPIIDQSYLPHIVANIRSYIGSASGAPVE